MKKTTARIMLIFMVLTMVISPLTCLFTYADDMWAEDYYRAHSSTGGLSDADRDDLDAEFIDFMSKYGVDFAALTLLSERLDEEPADFARDYYESCNFGYGDDKTGFMILYVQDENQVTIVPMGSAEKMFDSQLIQDAAEHAIVYYDQYGEWGVMYAAYKYIAGEIEENAEAGKEAVPALGGTEPESTDLISPAGTETGTPEAAGANTNLPSWYPASTADFQFFNDEKAPRVIDNADLLTDEEEEALEKMILACREDTAHDLVIVTDVTDYGLGQMGFADDYFDYNGYGIGEEREGALLFIDMDPNDRGGWCSCNGSDTRNLYTEDIANDIDDLVYSSLGKGEYNEAFNRWVVLMYTLFEKGDPFATNWMPLRGETVTRTQDPDAPRVVDEMDLLSDAQEADLEARLAEIREKYGVDIVLFTPCRMSTMSTRTYGKLLLDTCGYGLNDSCDSIIMSIRGGYCYADAYGSTVLTDVNKERIEEKAESAFEGGGAYKAALSYISDVEHMLKTGRVQKPLISWIISTVVGLLGGSVFGGISTSAAQAKMKVPKTATSAEEYLVRDSISIVGLYDTYLGTTTSRVYDPPEERSSGGGGSSSGGHSSYSGGHTSSSGSTHSGSGRKF